MFLAHFGLASNPFRETTNPGSYVALSTRESALRRLCYILEHDQGPAALHGPPGLGKSLLAQRLGQVMEARVVELGFPILPAPRLLQFLLNELAPGPAAIPARESIADLRDLLAATALAGHRPIVVVDDAHLVRDPETMGLLKLLHNFRSLGPPDLRLILAGESEFLLDLDPGLADLIACRVLLEPLDATESEAYVRGRLELAGATRAIFSEPALEALHWAALGRPRHLNRIASLALLIAYARDLDSVDETAVALAAAELPIANAA